MWGEVLLPLCRVLSPKVGIGGIQRSSLIFTHSYGVDLPAGVYSARDILNACCIAFPTRTFAVAPGPRGALSITPLTLLSMDRLSPPRAAAVMFWETEIGQPTNGTPSLEEIAVALSDPSPRKRWAARMYQNATFVNYKTEELEKSDDPERAIWAALAMKSMYVISGEQAYVSGKEKVMQAFTNGLAQRDPGLALLTAMELAREKKDPSIIDCVAGHKFTAEEIAVIQPDLYRIARQSKLVRDKLVQMKFDAPELSPESLRELENTNLFYLVPEDKVR
jgi:hypothetical protein